VVHRPASNAPVLKITNHDGRVGVQAINQDSGATTVGKINRVPLREVWKHEALDFTVWLRENIDALNDTLNLSLANAERERAAGDFSVDLVAEDESGDPVIVENQLEKSDHDHLGKLLTYLVARGAKTAVWIVSEPRPEHVSAVSWLNESSPASFYLVKVEAIRIGESPPAPLLTKVVGPSEEGREVGDTKKEWAERYIIRRRFWTELLERVAQRTSLHANIRPSRYNWLGTSAGMSGLGFNYTVRQHDAGVELYIDRGKESGIENEQIFDKLAASRDAIEKVFGEPLDWQRLENSRACRIKKQIDLGGYRDEPEWPEVHEAMIETMIRLEKALRPYISALRL
jgi:hypothetical protein